MGSLALAIEPLPLRHVGNQPIPRILPGPMEGVMTPWFCRAAVSLDLVEGWMTPFFRLSDNLPRRSKFARFLTPFLSSGKPVILQLLGSDAILMAEAARLAAESFNLAGIDVNFACPSLTVIKSGGGGALLRYPDEMVKIITAMRAALPELPLSVKLRTGYESEREMDAYIPALAAAGADFISVHFRTVKEVYSEAPGRAQRLTQAVKLADGLPVFGSGDVYSVADGEALMVCGCAGIMGARGWLRDPWLLRRLREKTTGNDVVDVNDYRQRFFSSLQHHAKQEKPPWPRPGLTGLAAFMWGVKTPEFRRLPALDDHAFWSVDATGN